MHRVRVSYRLVAPEDKRAAAERARRGEIGVDEIDEAMISRGLQLAGIPDPDLLIQAMLAQNLKTHWRRMVTA